VPEVEPVNLTITLSYGPFADRAEAEAFADDVKEGLDAAYLAAAHTTVEVYPEASS